ncbi:LysM peptidoglycan-binding domain-containing protein [candidate division KSB1 bacterium]|nr:LysM peptidoglycan-binding domain-containing protein [candidate division KSB1 bacterium]
MKKTLLLTGGTILLLAVLLPGAMVGGSNDVLKTPTIHRITEGEYLSKISLQYYHTAKYWRELALINRAPESNLVFPGEEIFVPSQKTIERIHQARSLSKVNLLFTEDERLVTPEPGKVDTTQAAVLVDSAKVVANQSFDSEPALTETAGENTQDEPSKSGSSMLFLIAGITGLAGLLVILGFVLIRRRKQAEDQDLLKELHELETDTLVIEDGDDSGNEPDYETYRKNRSERVYI